MLDVPVNLREQILFELNRTENLVAWQALLDSDAAREHRERERRVRHDVLRVSPRGARVRERAPRVRALPDATTSPAPRCSASAVRRPRRSMTSGGCRASMCSRCGVVRIAIRSGCAGASGSDRCRRSASGRACSTSRAGASRGGGGGAGAAPSTTRLMRLPYQRKYDRERNFRGDELLRWHEERILIAGDILDVRRGAPVGRRRVRRRVPRSRTRGHPGGARADGPRARRR